MLNYITLGMLSCGDNLTGYELKKLIENGIGVFYRASYGSLYPALKRLEADGFITMSEESTGNRRKKRYSITESGSAAFHNWLVAPIEISESANNHLAKVYFFDRLSPEQRMRLLSEYEANNLQYLRKLESLHQQFSQRNDMEPHYYKLSTLYYGIAVVRETLRWCRHISSGKPLQELLDEKTIESQFTEEDY